MQPLQPIIVDPAQNFISSLYGCICAGAVYGKVGLEGLPEHQISEIYKVCHGVRDLMNEVIHKIEHEGQFEFRLSEVMSRATPPSITAPASVAASHVGPASSVAAPPSVITDFEVTREAPHLVEAPPTEAPSQNTKGAKREAFRNKKGAARREIVRNVGVTHNFKRDKYEAKILRYIQLFVGAKPIPKSSFVMRNYALVKCQTKIENLLKHNEAVSTPAKQMQVNPDMLEEANKNIPTDIDLTQNSDNLKQLLIDLENFSIYNEFSHDDQNLFVVLHYANTQINMLFTQKPADTTSSTA